MEPAIAAQAAPLTRRVIHKLCGAQVGIRFGDNPRMWSRDFQRVDGTRPVHATVLDEHCPGCGRRIRSGVQLRVEQAPQPAG